MYGDYHLFVQPFQTQSQNHNTTLYLNYFESNLDFTLVMFYFLPNQKSNRTLSRLTLRWPTGYFMIKNGTTTNLEYTGYITFVSMDNIRFRHSTDRELLIPDKLDCF